MHGRWMREIGGKTREVAGESKGHCDKGEDVKVKER